MELPITYYPLPKNAVFHHKYGRATLLFRLTGEVKRGLDAIALNLTATQQCDRFYTRFYSRS
ncbi:MAG TPA: hypothetical protein DCP31_34080 [Cyanobacteria bacterium UBA8543]|nr:hypothetical protein [Cyanobacteria bacterium UBA8543]